MDLREIHLWPRLGLSREARPPWNGYAAMGFFVDHGCQTRTDLGRCCLVMPCIYLEGAKGAWSAARYFGAPIATFQGFSAVCSDAHGLIPSSLDLASSSATVISEIPAKLPKFSMQQKSIWQSTDILTHIGVSIQSR